jgi:hypothetical protein
VVDARLDIDEYLRLARCSLCGGPWMNLKVSSTIGFERADQALLAIDDEDAFVRETIAGLGPHPPAG